MVSPSMTPLTGYIVGPSSVVADDVAVSEGVGAGAAVAVLVGAAGFAVVVTG